MLAADAAQSAKPYDPMDIGVNRASFVIAAFNDVLMGSILPCKPRAGKDECVARPIGEIGEASKLWISRPGGHCGQ